MATIRHHAHIDRTPDDVWKVVSDAGAISTWFPGIDTASAQGTERRCSMGGVELVEEIVTVDDIVNNTDFGDSFEREGDNHEYFIEFSVPGNAFGINALVYSITL